MEENIVRTETLYTYEAAINQYERERHHAWLCRQKKLKEIRQEEQNRRTYFCNQKLCGLVYTIVAFILFILIRDPVCAIFVLPGIILISSKKMLIVNEYWWEQQRKRKEK